MQVISRFTVAVLRSKLRSVSLRCAVPGILLATMVIVPFYNKAFTIDDPLFLLQAEHILKDPFHPSAFELVWAEIPRPVRASRMLSSGPVMGYLLVPTVWSGGKEWVARVTQIVILSLGIWATCALALRLGLGEQETVSAGLLLAATPVAVAMAGTSMPDLPAMSLGVAGLERLSAWAEKRRWHQCLFSTLALGLSPLARLYLFLLPALGALLIVRDPWRPKEWVATPWASWLPLILAPVFSLALLFLTRDPNPDSGNPLSSAALFSSLSFVERNLVAFGAHWVLVLPLGIVWATLHWRRLLRWPVLWAGFFLAAVLLWHIGDRHWIPWIAPVAGLGVAILLDVLFDAWRRRDAMQAFLGLWLVLPLPAAYYIHFPSKFLLSSAPAVALLLARALGSAPKFQARMLLGIALSLGTLLGVLILRADSGFAGLGRRAAAELIAPQVAVGRRVWFRGHWGFHWYAERAGGQPVTVTPPYPAKGDLVVSSLRLPGLGINCDTCRLVMTLTVNASGGRLMDRDAGAGFFSNYWGYLPWAWSRDEFDRFDLWEIR